jgi:pimeloyl-ACP methyl ester carboxylesterase
MVSSRFNSGVSVLESRKSLPPRPPTVWSSCSYSATGDELYQAPRSWAERAYPKLIHYNKLDKGGHFAAWEQPKLFAEEVRAGFRSLRNAI